MASGYQKIRAVSSALRSYSPWRIGLLSFGVLAALAGIAAAVEHYFTSHIPRLGNEQRLVFKLDAPYGSVDLRPGTGESDIATIETLDEDRNPHNPQWSHGMKNETIGLLTVGIGTDEGMIDHQPLAMWYTNSAFSLASAQQIQSDRGITPVRTFSFPPLPYPRFVAAPQYRVISTDAVNITSANSNAGTRIHLTKDIPVEFWADLGFGESSLDLSGLALTNANIETGASRATIRSFEANPQVMNTCAVKAGIGQCTFNGIANLNANRFSFRGGVGSYHLGFEGHLTHDMDAVVDVGLGMCTISIPPTAARVQVFYEDGLLNSFSFTGLAMRHDGYACSPGFEYGKGPALTLHLSSGAGKMAVSYH